MKKINFLFAALIGFALVGCSSREGYPANPVEGQQYRDSHGNNSVWNAALGCWMISSMVNGRSVQHHYYPSTDTYRNPSTNSVVPRPSHIPSVTRKASSNSNVTTNSTGGKSTSSRGAAIGTSGRSSGASS